MVQHPDYQNLHQDYIDRLKFGDPKAQFEIYKLYYRSMYNTSLRIVGTAEDAEDIMQDSFLSAYGRIDTYSGKVSFGAWLKKIVINKSLDFLKSKKKILITIDEAEIELEVAYNEDETVYDGISTEQVRDAIQALPEGYRLVLSLYLLEGYDHEEIAGILDISSSTSRSQFTRARQKIVEILKGNNKT